jgi:hypothetical protein
MVDDPPFFDDLDETESTPLPQFHSTATFNDMGSNDEILSPECRRLSIPSTWLSPDDIYRVAELDLRIIQADRCIQALRDSIADKSFQYSHVIRVAPRKAVGTRARSIIAKLNQRISHYCRVYSSCRAAIVRLHPDAAILSKYRILTKDDVKSSSALLNPNQPGSSTLKLSWIWQSGQHLNDGSHQALHECE